MGTAFDVICCSWKVNNFSRRPKSKLSRGALANKQTRREGTADPPSLGPLSFIFSNNQHVCWFLLKLSIHPTHPGQGETRVYLVKKFISGQK